MAKFKKPKKPTLTKLKKVLDSLVSEYVRRRSADFQGNVKCVCCGRIKKWQEIQNGHYVGRAHLNTRWDLRNCHPCCVGCNVFLKGNYPAYTDYLLQEFGQEWLKKLIDDGKKIRKWTTYDLQKEIERFKDLLKTL